MKSCDQNDHEEGDDAMDFKIAMDGSDVGSDFFFKMDLSFSQF